MTLLLSLYLNQSRQKLMDALSFEIYTELMLELFEFFDKLFDCCLYWEILNFETDVREIVRMFSILPETRFPQFSYN